MRTYNSHITVICKQRLSGNWEYGSEMKKMHLFRHTADKLPKQCWSLHRNVLKQTGPILARTALPIPSSVHTSSTLWCSRLSRDREMFSLAKIDRNPLKSYKIEVVVIITKCWKFPEIKSSHLLDLSEVGLLSVRMHVNTCRQLSPLISYRRRGGGAKLVIQKLRLAKAASPVNRCHMWRKKSSVSKTRAEPKTTNPHCIGDRRWVRVR